MPGERERSQQMSRQYCRQVSAGMYLPRKALTGGNDAILS
jgi:hypothetical protein